MTKLQRISFYLAEQHHKAYREFEPLYVLQGYFNAMHIISSAMLRPTKKG